MSDGAIISVANVNKGATVDKPADPAREGYNFGGWYVDSNFAEEFRFDAFVSDNLILYAKWISAQEPVAPTPTPESTPTPTSANLATTMAPAPAISTVSTQNVGSNSPANQVAVADSDGETSSQTSAADKTNSAVDSSSVANVANQSTTSDDSAGEVLGARDDKSWSLTNLILAGLTALISIIMLLAWLGKEKDDDNRHGFLRVLTLVPAVGAVAAVLLLEDLSLPMQFVDVWTWLMAAILAVQIVLAVLATRLHQTRDEKTRLNE